MTVNLAVDPEMERLFPGDSELAGRMRRLNHTDSGTPTAWPQNLRVAVSLCLTSRIPIVMYWGPRFTVLYNDAYTSFLGETKHPRFLGQPGRECWSEIWDTIGPMLEHVRRTGQATWSEDLLMFFARRLHARKSTFGSRSVRSLPVMDAQLKASSPPAPRRPSRWSQPAGSKPFASSA